MRICIVETINTILQNAACINIHIYQHTRSLVSETLIKWSVATPKMMKHTSYYQTFTVSFTWLPHLRHIQPQQNIERNKRTEPCSHTGCFWKEAHSSVCKKLKLRWLQWCWSNSRWFDSWKCLLPPWKGVLQWRHSWRSGRIVWIRKA